MKKLFENWRGFLTEGIMTLENLPEKYFIKITQDNNGYQIGLIDSEHNDQIGLAILEKAIGDEEGERFENAYSEDQVDEYLSKCPMFENLWTFHLYFEGMQGQGYGPLFADIAMEIAYENRKEIIPAAMVGGAGTTGAQRLYDYYYNRREDIDHDYIDEECWAMFMLKDNKYLEELYDYPDSFKAIYWKEPTILDSPMAEKKIKWG